MTKNQRAQPLANIKFDQLQRYRLIEIVALWEGKLNASHLTDYFGIGRQQASKDINAYNNDVAPDNLIYNSSLKGYQPTEHFSPVVTSGLADEYLQLVSRNNDLVNTFQDLSLGFDCTHRVMAPEFAVKPSVLRAIINACKNRKRVEVDYRSVNSPNKDGRIIVPHSIVHSGMRWHVRAYCEKNKSFRDFVLTRLHGAPEQLDMCAPNQYKENDEKWNTQVHICFMPDIRLSEEQQMVVAQDYGMTNNRLLITVRAALVTYLMQLMRVDIHSIAADPKAQQIVVENIDALKQWVFN